MITFYVQDSNIELTQDIYNSYIFNLDLNTLKCTCGHFGVVAHGYYKRSIKTITGKIKIKILRVKCKTCNKTHAILLSLIIPYSSVQLKDHIRIIKDIDIKELMIEKITIDESTIYRIKHNFKKFFKQMMISYNISFDDDLIKNCFKYLKRNFNQIKLGCNILYTWIHITCLQWIISKSYS